VRNQGLCLAAGCIVLAALLISGASTRVNADGETLIGAWMVTTTTNTPSGTPPIVFTELATFNAGGTWADTHAIAHNSQNPFAPPPAALDSSDAYGSWRRLGDSNQFQTALKRLLFAGPNTPAVLYGPFFPGQHVGFETVNAVLTVQPDGTFQGLFRVEFANLGGQVVFADTGSVSAKRLTVAP
jgi:hypothetical protein